MNVLGLNFFHPNASAAVFVDGHLVAAAEEERFNRVKASAGMPHGAIAYCLEAAGLRLRDLDYVTHARASNIRVLSEDQILFQEPIYRAESAFDQLRIGGRLMNLRQVLARHLGEDEGRVKFELKEVDHHHAHMMNGYHYSGFDRAIGISFDSFGDFQTGKVSILSEGGTEDLFQFDFPSSVGLFYTMVTHFLGFHAYGDESKVMGLSTFGYPEYRDRLRTILSYEDGRIDLNLKYFNYENGMRTAWWQEVPDISRVGNGQLRNLIGDARTEGEPLTEKHQNLAASLQTLVEETVFHFLTAAQEQSGITDIVLSGGLANNSVLNGRIIPETGSQAVCVPPAPGNGGLAVGSALAFLGAEAERLQEYPVFSGPAYSPGHIRQVLDAERRAFTEVSSPAETAADLLARGKKVAWFQGRMEFGARSLGARCILINPQMADPREVKDRYRLKPFGLSILTSCLGELLRDPTPSPFMALMGKVKYEARPRLERILLNDYCRYQSVGDPENPLHAVLKALERRTGLPFLINTSLNREGEPILATPSQLIQELDQLHVDAAIINRFLVPCCGGSGNGNEKVPNPGQPDFRIC